MSKHSDGPWEARTNNIGHAYNEPYCTIDDGSKSIAHVMLRDWPRRKDIAEWRENARLIAAAPALLEALRPFDIHWLDHPVLSDELFARITILGTGFEAEISIGELRAARNALRKATGEQQ